MYNIIASFLFCIVVNLIFPRHNELSATVLSVGSEPASVIATVMGYEDVWDRELRTVLAYVVKPAGSEFLTVNILGVMNLC